MHRRQRLRERRLLAEGHRLRTRLEHVEDAELAPIALETRSRIARSDEPEWIDLLHQQPRVPLEIDRLRGALRFAFESGDAGGLLSRAVDEAPLGPSSWNRETFADGLFLGDLVDECFPIVVAGTRHAPSRTHLLRVLSAPPDDARDVALRQGVLRELAANRPLRARVESIYGGLRQLRSLLDEQPISPEETIRRKVEVLQVIRGVLDEADEGLRGVSSALRRLHDVARTVRESDVYQRLEQILDFEANLATVDVRVVLGSDGRIRDFQLVELRENRDNPLVRSAWARAWTRLVAWLRGHRYGEHEVLLRVVDEVFADLEDVLIPWFRLIGHLEVHLAALGFRDLAARAGLQVSLPTVSPTPAIDAPAGPMALTRLFNPLLLMQGLQPVPCDVCPAGHDALVLVTGPNSGGKTRLLQAIGITQVLGQCGLFVPAAEAAITCAPSMFVSLIESGRADQAEGRLGTELMRVRRLFEQLRPGSVAILDELCSGTNPSEGIAIFEMVIQLLPRLRPQVFLTTHFLDAARALAEARPVERLEFLQVELDASAAPTYQFVPGVAPTSLAHQVASRLGVTQEELEALVTRQEAKVRDPHGVAPHGVDPHGVDPHGVAPHGVDPHGIAPHGVDPHGVAPHGVSEDSVPAKHEKPDGAVSKAPA